MFAVMALALLYNGCAKVRLQVTTALILKQLVVWAHCCLSLILQ